MYSLADIAIAPPFSTSVDQSPRAGMEPVRSIVSPKVVISSTVKVIGTVASSQVLEGGVVGAPPPIGQVRVSPQS